MPSCRVLGAAATSMSAMKPVWNPSCNGGDKTLVGRALLEVFVDLMQGYPCHSLVGY